MTWCIFSYVVACCQPCRSSIAASAAREGHRWAALYLNRGCARMIDGVTTLAPHARLIAAIACNDTATTDATIRALEAGSKHELSGGHS